MPIEYFPAPDPSWESLYDQAPIAMLDRHPSGEFVALRVTYQNGAAVWRTDTKRLARHRDQARALSWTPDGNEIALVRDDYQHEPELHNLVERYTWPGGELIEGTKLTLPMGWVEDIVIAPTRKRAAVAWVDLDGAGIEIVSWEDGTLRQMTGDGYSGSCNIMAPPTFSPDGRYVILAFGIHAWWVDEDLVDDSSDDFSEDDYLNTPSRGGNVCCGEVVIGDFYRGIYQGSAIVVRVPKRWLPADPQRAANQFVGRPVFRDANTFAIRLGDLGEQTFSVSGRGAR